MNGPAQQVIGFYTTCSQLRYMFFACGLFFFEFLKKQISGSGRHLVSDLILQDDGATAEMNVSPQPLIGDS